MLKFLKHILQLIISPAKGWEDVSSAGIDPRELTRRGLYPLLAILAITCLIRPLYASIEYSLVEALQNAIVSFTVYFATLFIAGAAFSTFMPTLTENAGSNFKNQSFVIFCLGILITINIISNLIPGDLVILKILPVYVIFVMFNGVRYLDVTSSKIGHFMFLAVLSIAAPPYILSFFFNLLMPAA